MRYVLLLIALLLFSPSLLSGQTKVSGFVRDQASGERLIGANVYEAKTLSGTTTDLNGFFTLIIQTPAEIIISHVGYQKQTIPILASNDTMLQVLMIPGEMLGEVEIRAEPFTRAEVVRIDSERLQKSVGILGTRDIIKALHNMPGIASQGEASSLMLVRGGNPGENAYLIDNVPLIHVHHVGGFVSVFNPDIINEMELYKGNFPARFGGRLSSILNLTLREGNRNKWKGSTQLGLMDLSAVVEGPLNRNSSIIVAGRKSIYDLLILGATLINPGDVTAWSGYHDLNAKISVRPNERTSLHFNLYQGDNNISFRTKDNGLLSQNEGRMDNKWGNLMVSASLKHAVSSGLFLESQLSINRYRSRENIFSKTQTGNETETFSSNFLSRLDSYLLSSTLKWKASRKISKDFGFSVNRSVFMPVSYEASDLLSNDYSRVLTSDLALFYEGVFDLPAGFRINAGCRLNWFINERYRIVMPEPRLSLYKKMGANHQLSLGLMRVHQTAHLLFTPGTLFSTQIWIPSDNQIKPSSSNQVSLSWISELAALGVRTELSIYHKVSNNLATYKEGLAHLKGSPFWKSKIETEGIGESNGFELLINKKSKNWSSTIAYTLSKTTRQFENINDGKPFNFDFDRRHNLALTADYSFNPRVFASATWTFQSGLPYTPVIGRHLSPSSYFYELSEVLVYGERNSARMRNYHRLDFSVTLSNLNKSNQVVSSWTFGLYNAYNRRNPSFYYLLDEESVDRMHPSYSGERPVEPAMYQMSIFPILPVISYRYNFGVSDEKLGTEIRRIINNILFL